MADRSTEIKVGITVVAAFFILVVGTAWLAELRLNRGGYELPVVFDEVGGLDVGDPVTVAGVEMGEVREIDLREQDVLVTLWLTEGTRIPRDSRVAVENIGLMGEKFVAVSPGTSLAAAEPASELRGEYTPGLSEVMGAVGEAVPRLTRLADLLEDALAGGGGEEGGKPGVLAEATAAARDLRAVIAENREDLRQATRSFRSFSREAHTLVQGKRGVVEETIDRLAGAARDLEAAADRLERASSPVEEAAGRLGEGEGTLGKLIHEEELYHEIRRAVRDLDSLIVDIRENPRRYFKMEIF